MGKIFYLMGKSASGKDSLYSSLKESYKEFKPVVLYTTRPMREGEEEGIQYHFIDTTKYEEFKNSGLIIESRDYNTVHGVWSYMTVKDGQINLAKDNYLMIGTLESYNNMVKAYGPDALIPLYIFVDDGVRLARALEREKQQKEPKYAEMCRRFLADEADFSEENLKESKIDRCFINDDFNRVLKELVEYIDGLK